MVSLFKTILRIHSLLDLKTFHLLGLVCCTLLYELDLLLCFKLHLSSECHCLSYDALTAHVSLVFIRYMFLSLQQRRNTDDRTISELFLLMVDELADIAFAETLQIIVDILLRTMQDRFGLTDDQLIDFVRDFYDRLPISYQHTLRLAA